MDKTMKVKVLLDTRLETAWQTVGTVVVPKGFICVSVFTDKKALLKIGDGITAWNALPYLNEAEPVDLSDYYTKEQTDTAITTAINAAVSGVFVLKGRVDTVEDLPAEGNKNGWVYLVGLSDATEFQEYYWTGTFWDYMGKTAQVDLTDYYKKSEVDALVKTVSDKVDTTNTNVSNLVTRVETIEADYIKSTDVLILNSSLD